jgi:hypothetical protein
VVHTIGDVTADGIPDLLVVQATGYVGIGAQEVVVLDASNGKRVLSWRPESPDSKIGAASAVRIKSDGSTWAVVGDPMATLWLLNIHRRE